ncbi:non-canonical purine NTP pyrophosphatase, RdgB/HAM1 family [Candidatus Bathyarchaeota archaeon]|nr:MAG: non-canonical purine NTP pyrophosphatase, RdgB/HAM1 family [Candidatus Bathyarchaeota archaeon]
MGRLIYFATNNIHKFNEARLILAEYNIAVAMLRAKTPEIQDDNIENIAKLGAVETSRKTHLPVIVEDAGLFINALNGFPGPYSSYVYQTLGKEGILRLLEGCENRRARFKSAIAFHGPGMKTKCFLGVVEGKISNTARGESGFGFDPIFEPDKFPSRTFGELSVEEKNKVSHRSRALRRFAEWYLKIKKDL